MALWGGYMTKVCDRALLKLLCTVKLRVFETAGQVVHCARGIRNLIVPSIYARLATIAWSVFSLDSEFQKSQP